MVALAEFAKWLKVILRNLGYMKLILLFNYLILIIGLVSDKRD